MRLMRVRDAMSIENEQNSFERQALISSFVVVMLLFRGVNAQLEKYINTFIRDNKKIYSIFAKKKQKKKHQASIK